MEDCWARDQILEKKWIHIWYGSVTFISIPIALSVVYLYCLNEGLRFTMLCSYGVWRAVINLTNFQNDCDICEKYFTWEWLIDTHIKRGHDADDWMDIWCDLTTFLGLSGILKKTSQTPIMSVRQPSLEDSSQQFDQEWICF